MIVAFVVPLGQSNAPNGGTTKAMDAILPLILCLHPEVTMTMIRQLSRIAVAMLAISGRVTMRGLARWAGTGGSYRTVQRFFHTTLPWAALLWTFVRTQLLVPGDRYLLVGDECVTTKAGSHTYGVDRFFSSIFGKPVPGVALFALALVSCTERHAFPVQVEQIVRAPAVAPPLTPAPAKRKPGRPKGSSTQAKADAPLNPEHTRIHTMIQGLLTRMRPFLALTYLVLDGHFGNHNAVLMARRLGLQLISKLRSDSALYYPYDGPYAGRGPHRIYGERIDPTAIPERFLQQTTQEDGIETRIYQVEARHATFDQPLNVVVIVKQQQTTGKQAHIYLFSSDHTLAWDALLDAYQLRFQIEFAFRDAKQYWGLEDFMVIKETAVTNAMNLAFFMVNLSRRLLRDRRCTIPNASVLDRKADYRGRAYAEELIKLLPEKPEPGLLQRLLARVTKLGRIHPLPSEPSP
jgi:putative transposase